MFAFGYTRAAASLGALVTPAPVITSLNYTVGDTIGGGQSIVITGTDMGSASSVTFGGTSATITGNNSTTVTVTLPAKTAGVCDVVVTTPSGTSTGGTNAFEYWAPIQLTSCDTVLDIRKGWSTGDWTDQKSSIHWTNGSTPPTLSSNEFGSVSGLVFVQATPTTLVPGTLRNLASADRSMFAVAKWTSTDGTAAQPSFNVPLTILGNSGGWNGFGASAGAVAVSSYNNAGSVPSGQKTGGSSLNNGSAHIIGITNTNSTEAAQLYADGSAVGSALTGIGINSVRVLGGGYTTADGFEGTLAAAIITKSVVSGGDITKLYEWARQSFGVT